MPTIKINSTILDALSSNNCVMKVNGVPVTLNFVIPIGSEVTIEINGNYNFEAPPTWQYSDFYGGFISRKFTLVNPKLARLIQPDFSDTDQASMNWVTLDIDIIPAAIEVSGNNRVYLISEEQLQTINKERFISVGGTPFDYGQFIIGLIELPFKLPDSYVAGEDLIKLGKRETSVSAPSISSDKVTFALGTIVIPPPETGLDITLSTAKLYIPRTPAIELDVTEIIGQTLTISLEMDLYSGKGDYLVISTKSNLPIIMQPVDFSLKIPYGAVGNGSIAISNPSMAIGGDNGLLSAYVEISKHEAMRPDNYLVAPVEDFGILSGKTGFIKVEEIELQTSATYSERQQILSILGEGVIINKTGVIPVAATPPVLAKPIVSVRGLTATIEDLGIVSGTTPMYVQVFWRYTTATGTKTLVNWALASDNMVKTLPTGSTKFAIQVRAMNVKTMPNYVTGPLEEITL